MEDRTGGGAPPRGSPFESVALAVDTAHAKVFDFEEFLDAVF
jgi:hypothetical protein